MNIEESKSYNALNIACFSNYETLLKKFESSGSWEKAWLKFQKSSPIDKEEAWQKLKKYNISLILQSDPSFPEQLKEIPWPPLALYLLGAPLKKDEIMIALVGTRKATSQGKTTAKKFAKDLSVIGFTVVSGLAFGIDASAHEGVTDAQGRTVAVLANGLDRIYPRTHEELAKKILELDGTLISEYPIGSPSLQHRFIERNRIVSGLSRGIIIIEAPENSGALTTAKFALEQNREVLVIPGPFDHPNYLGSHGLIKAGAGLITSIQDILVTLNLEELARDHKIHEARKILDQLDENQKAVISVLEAASSSIDTESIAELTQLEVPILNSALSFLIIKGLIKEESGKYLIANLWT